MGSRVGVFMLRFDCDRAVGLSGCRNIGMSGGDRGFAV